MLYPSLLRHNTADVKVSLASVQRAAWRAVAFLATAATVVAGNSLISVIFGSRRRGRSPARSDRRYPIGNDVPAALRTARGGDAKGCQRVSESSRRRKHPRAGARQANDNASVRPVANSPSPAFWRKTN